MDTVTISKPEPYTYGFWTSSWAITNYAEKSHVGKFLKCIKMASGYGKWDK